MSVISKLAISIQTALGDARTAGTIAAGTTGLSFAQVMGWLQANIGFIGMLSGVALTMVTIWVQVSSNRRGHAEYALAKEKTRIDTERAKIDAEKSRIELEILKRKLEE